MLYANDFIEDDNAAHFAMGKMKLLPAEAGRGIVIAVATPPLPQTSATIGHVMKEGNLLVLAIDVWQSPTDLESSATFNGQKVQMLYLPPLSAGKYKLQVQWRIMTPPQHEDGSDYSWTDVKTAELPFMVMPADIDTAANTFTPILPFAALQPAISLPPSDVKIQPAWWVSARRFQYDKAILEKLVVGCCNNPFDSFQGAVSDVQFWSALPKFDHPDAEESLEAMIICPPMNSGEWASIAAIHWKGTTAVIDVDLWTDAEDHKRNRLTIPVLPADLDPPARRPALAPIEPPGHYKIEVKMQRLRAERPGGWYVPVSESALRTQFDVK